MRRMSRSSTPPEDDYGTEEEERPSRRSRRTAEAEPSNQRRRTRGFAGPDNMDTDDDYEDDEDGGDYEDDVDERPRTTRTHRTQRSEGRGDRESRTTRSTRSRGDSDERQQDRRGFHTANMKTYKEKVAESSMKYRRFDVEERKDYPIAFLQPEPFAHFFRHWVLVDGKRRPYVCLGDVCPLCECGDRAKPVLMFNIYDFSDDQVKVWEMSKDPAKKVEKRYDALDKKGKKLNSPGVFFTVSKEKGSNNIIAYDVAPLPVDDLEDLGIEPLTRDEIADLKDKLYDDTIVYTHSLSDLHDVVDKAED